MGNDKTNMFVAIGLSLLVLLGWQYFVAGPRVEQQRLIEAQNKAAQQQQQPPGVTPDGVPSPSPKEGGPAAPVPGTVPGQGGPVSPEAALTLARDAEPAPIEMRVAGMEAPGLAVGRAVTVTPDDFARIPVRGSLVALDAERIVIRREDEKVGTIHLHFPRAGFEVAAIA